jgi:hypothetical protein
MTPPEILYWVVVGMNGFFAVLNIILAIRHARETTNLRKARKQYLGLIENAKAQSDQLARH